MSLNELLPWVAAGIFLVTASVLMNSSKEKGAGAWLFPLGFALLFILWSLAAAVGEGPLGFWPEHTRNMWGNQIWFDLLLAIGVAWAFIVPRAKEQGMRLSLWLLLILSSGSIGVLIMVARLLYLQGKQSRAQGL